MIFPGRDLCLKTHVVSILPVDTGSYRYTRPAIMAHKRKTTSTCALVLVWIFVATARAQDILVFNGTMGLPDCAYSCTALYSAQSDCQSAVDRVDCFCASTNITSKAKGWGCDEACVAESDKKRVASFLASICGTEEESTDDNTASNDGDQENDSISSRGVDGHNSTSAASSAPNGEDPQTDKAKNW
jgi:hypothetical protein